ncbi:MAG: TSUP family transporter [Nitriliruptorales bacterium]|nr:TSUP family transporter [Nitriliruptorales bacterium]
MTDIVVIVLAIALGAFVKGATGSGLPLIAIPVMAVFLGVERSIVIMTIPGIVSNAWMLWALRHHLHRTRDLPAMLGTGMIGVLAGTWLLKTLDAPVLSLALAAMIFVYVLLFFAHPDLRLPPATTRYLSVPVGAVAGALQGATGLSGPVLLTWLHAYRLEKEVYLVSIVTLFQLFTVAQVFSLTALGLYTPERVRHSLLALLPLVVLPLGTRLARRMPQRAFELLVLSLLVAVALKMVYDAVTVG